MTFTMTVPDRVGDALKKKGAEYDTDAIGYLKQFLFAAAHSPVGVVMKLDLPPLKEDPAQLALPLAGVATN